MLNLANIGFYVNSEKELFELIENTAKYGEKITCKYGIYSCIDDVSGAQLYCQLKPNGEIIGMNPHFAGKSKRKIGIEKIYRKIKNKMDGAFHAWAEPKTRDINSGLYPFVFDTPNFATYPNFKKSKILFVQLTAFAGPGFSLFETEEELLAMQQSKVKLTSNLFLPGLVMFPEINKEMPQALCIFGAKIIHWELLTNSLTGLNFYWFLAETQGGSIDVVASPNLVFKEPKINGILSGQFWLSGKLKI